MKSEFQERVSATTLREYAQRQILDLRIKEQKGEISNLKIDQVFPHVVNGISVWDLLVDAVYMDEKGNMQAKIFRSFLDKDSEEMQLKIVAFNADYGNSLEVVSI